ncbi:transmembrane protein 41A-like [Penaeus chinensis]|uniref:transmembrane protein 41A-like n=1 Tax=Penaeus chinensis TaxID=139456 RepID=UPI001FB64EC5|nr:transmembrane protein 41A-like [Penaeus chinensis]
MEGIRRRDYARLLIAPVAFATASFFLWFVFVNRPALRNGITPDLHFPKSLDDLRELVRVSSAYKEDHWYYVVFLFSSAYIYKQTFAIPGSALLNLLGGALLGCWPLGFPLCCVLTATGASNCFLLSRLVGKKIIQRKFATKINWFREKISENENQLFLFLVSLRVFPMTPNWLLNIMAPYVNVPLLMFFLSVFFGLLPYNFLCVQAGEMLSDIKSMDDIFTPKRLLALITIALIMFTLSHFARKRKAKHTD